MPVYEYAEAFVNRVLMKYSAPHGFESKEYILNSTMTWLVKHRLSPADAAE
jgi:hypothetical protein